MAAFGDDMPDSNDNSGAERTGSIEEMNADDERYEAERIERQRKSQREASNPPLPEEPNG